MVVDSLENLCIDRLFLLGYELLKNDFVENFYIFMKDITFAERPSQKLLKQILLNDRSLLNNFAPYLSSLSNITLETMNFKNLEFLQQFNLSSFSCRSMKYLDIDDFLNNFNMTTRSKMRYLRLRKIEIKNDYMLLLPQFVNVKFLDLSHTSLTTLLLKQLCVSLSFLVGLNISVTNVDNLIPLRRIARQLEFLDIHNLTAGAYKHIFEIIGDMCKLQYLDVSVADYVMTNLVGDADLVTCHCFTNLRLLDLSGHQGNIPPHLIVVVLQKMQHLKYFIYNPDSSSQKVSDIDRMKPFIKDSPRLTVAGAFSRQTMINSLVYSLEHRRYLTISLHLLYNKTRSTSFVNDILKTTLIEHMRRISGYEKHDRLVAITAVLYNITKANLAQNHWTVPQLSEVMALLLNFLDRSDDFQQLTVNIFLIVCNDHIMQSAIFDKLRLAQLIFRGMARFDAAENISHAGVIVISVIASELTKFQLNVLVSDVTNFRVLLSLICRRCLSQSDLDDSSVIAESYLAQLRSSLRVDGGDPLFDFTLKYALSCLWNLTDECTLACQQFIDQQGLFIYFVMIDKFRTALPDIHSHIFNKCLGLLNNIVEESSCRLSLLRQRYMDFLIEMLDQEDIQMTYFAGGILSNLLLISDDEWVGKCVHDKGFYENRIYVTVESWVSPNYLMASYRSFCPFENLIANAGSSRAILIWALWAIRHTLKIERSRYQSLLGKHTQLLEYITSLSTNHNPLFGRIRNIASDILLLNEATEDSDVMSQMMIE